MMTFCIGHGRSLSHIFACLLLVSCCLGSSVSAQAPQTPPPAQQPQPAQSTGTSPTSAPTLKVTTREVLVDVIVTDKAGQPVTGLKTADFSVSEEGEPQTIRRVDEHQPMPVTDVEKLTALPELPANTFSNFTPVRNTNASIVLLLDAMDSPVEAQMVMRQQLIDYLKHMQPGPPVAIFQLDTEMRLIQGFTSDPKVLLAAAESKRDMPSIARPNAAPRSNQADAVYRRALAEALRSGMRMMSSYLAGFPGRKNLIWFTGQVPMTIMGLGFGNPFRDRLTVRDTGDDLTDLTDVLTVSRVAVYPVDTRGLSVMPDLAGTGRRGFPNPRSNFFDHTNMDMVAEQTGGKAYYNTNDFTRVITDVVNTGSSYYTIAYATTNSKWNGELRRIKVALDRPDLQLQHKQGYYAYSLDKREESGIESIEKRRIDAAQQQSTPPQPSSDAQIGDQPPASGQEANRPAYVPALGATIPHSSNGGFSGAMELGAIPPTEIVFAAKIEPDSSTGKLNKESPLPPDSFMKAEWQHKPFRNVTILYDTDAHKIRFTQTPDGIRHGEVEFVGILYTGDGQIVNSIVQNAHLSIFPDKYREVLVSGLHVSAKIAVPVKGNFFLRLGIHDQNSDEIGALEIRMDQVKLEAPGASSPAP